jgi:hypothetical protein
LIGAPKHRESHHEIVRYFAVPHAASGWTVKRPEDRKTFRAHTVIGHWSSIICHFLFTNNLGSPIAQMGNDQWKMINEKCSTTDSSGSLPYG